MATATRAGRPGNGNAHLPGTQHQLDRELLELERRKLVQLTGSQVRITPAGYRELARRFTRRRS